MKANVFKHEGVEFNLDDYEWVDVLGVVWSWTGQWTSAGEPLMSGGEHPLNLTLPDVYHHHGPLIPRQKREAVVKRPPCAAFLESLRAGYVENDEAFAARIGGWS